MTFESPRLLWLLLSAPALVGVYLFVLRRKTQALQYSSLRLVRPAIGRWHGLRRHLPPFLFLLAIASLVVAVAQPGASISLLSNQRTIILVMDVSLSMAMADVTPNRFAAAKAAAKAFIKERPDDVRVGIVAFAGAAQVAQTPTLNRGELEDAIDDLQLNPETAIGRGMLAALATLFPDISVDEHDPIFDSRISRALHTPWTVRPDSPEDSVAQRGGAGRSSFAAIVLLSDGASNTGIDPLTVAKIAANRGIRCFTVGFGSPEEIAGDEDGSLLPGFDESTLRAIAKTTGAEYFQAPSAEDLQNVYRDLSARIVSAKNRVEITALFTAMAAVLSLLAASLSLAWFKRSN